MMVFPPPPPIVSGGASLKKGRIQTRTTGLPLVSLLGRHIHHSVWSKRDYWLCEGQRNRTDSPFIRLRDWRGASLNSSAQAAVTGEAD